MSESPRRRPSAAMVVAIIALVVATTGSAVAGPIGSIAKKLIDGSSIKPHSIAGNRLKNHTLTGKQISLAKLGTVPRASHATLADVASNAARLGGQSPASFLPSSKLITWSFSMNKGSAAHPFAVGPLVFTATCAADGANTDGKLVVSTTENNTFVTNQPFGLGSGASGGTVLNVGSPPVTLVEQDTSASEDGNSGWFSAFDMAGKIAVFSDNQTLGVAINTPGADCRFFGYLINDAG